MTTLRDSLLPVIDVIRGILDAPLGMRQCQVSVVTNTWTGGAYPGAPGSTKTQVVTPLKVDGQSPGVTLVSQKDIIASGGLYQEMDLRVGPLTPKFTGGGIDPTTLDNQSGGQNTEIFFLVSGPGIGSGSGYYKKVGQTLIPGNFRYEIVIRKTAQQAV